jgi:hypothetical protein
MHGRTGGRFGLHVVALGATGWLMERFTRPTLALGDRSLRASSPHRDERSNHLSGPLQHPPGVVVAQDLECLGERPPLAGGDPLVDLRTGLTVGTLE